MSGWEYRVVYFDPGGITKTTIYDSDKGIVSGSKAVGADVYAKLVADYLNQLGEEGWEAVGLVDTRRNNLAPETSTVTVLMKRQKL